MQTNIKRSKFKFPRFTLFGGVVAATVALFTLLIVITAKSHNTTTDGQIVDKIYTPSSTTIGYGGKSTKVYYTPEKYILVVSTDIASGTHETNAQVYTHVKVGDHVVVVVNSVWGIIDVQPKSSVN